MATRGTAARRPVRASGGMSSHAEEVMATMARGRRNEGGSRGQQGGKRSRRQGAAHAGNREGTPSRGESELAVGRVGERRLEEERDGC